MLRTSLVVVACLLVACDPAYAAANWTTLRTANFLFVGDAPEAQIRNVARKLEKFRGVLARALPGTPAVSPVPTTVVVFATGASLAPYRPQFRGKPVEVAGYFLGAEDVNYIAVVAQRRRYTAFRTIFHEYSHFLANSSAPAIPLWVNEGLAGVYSTFEEQNGGRTAVIGLAPGEHVALLRKSKLMPLRELFAVTRSSPVYNEGSKRGVFYAQSWALVHYLMYGNAARGDQLRTYLDALRGGVPDEQAFRSAFGDRQALEQELSAYIRNETFPAQRFDFSAAIRNVRAGRGQPLSLSDAQGYLGDLLVRLNRPADARALLANAIKEQPQGVRAPVSLGLLHLAQNHLDEALAVLGPVAARAPDDPVAQAAYGRVLVMSLATQTDRAAREGLLRNARVALSRAVELDPNAVLPTAMLGYVELLTGTLPRAIALFEKASQMAPARDQYRLMAAEALIRQRELTRATAYLEPLLARGATKEIRDSARERLGVIAQIQRTARAGEPGSPGRAADDIPEESLRALIAPDGEKTPTAGGGSSAPTLRLVGPGESRVPGLLRAVECRRDAVLLQVEANGRTFHLTARRFDDIEIISYVSSASASLSCGVLSSPARVLATYHPLAAAVGGIDGQAVAIELIPESYIPRD